MMCVSIGKQRMTINRKIICHWSGGNYIPNSIDREHYHYLIGFKDGKAYIEKGLFSVEDNDNCYDGRYAQHTGGGNTGAVGIAICGMYQATRADYGKYPITEAQYDKMCRLIAEVAHKYSIPITKERVMTHYEFGKLHPQSSSRGKIDISFLPFNPHLQPDRVGEDIRELARFWYEKLYKV